jgi:hypothetical protein
MPNSNPIAITSLILNLVVLKNLVTRGVITAELLKEQMDVALLTLEQSDLVRGDEGKAVHANLVDDRFRSGASQICLRSSRASSLSTPAGPAMRERFDMRACYRLSGSQERSGNTSGPRSAPT